MHAAQKGGNPLLTPQPLLGGFLEPVNLGRDRGVAPAGFPGLRYGGPVARVDNVPRLARLLGAGGVHRFQHRSGRRRQFRHPHPVALQLCRDILAVLALGRPLRLGDPAQAVAEPPRRDNRIDPLQLRRLAGEHPVMPAQLAELLVCRVDPRRGAGPALGAGQLVQPGLGGVRVAVGALQVTPRLGFGLLH